VHRATSFKNNVFFKHLFKISEAFKITQYTEATPQAASEISGFFGAVLEDYVAPEGLVS